MGEQEISPEEQAQLIKLGKQVLEQADAGNEQAKEIKAYAEGFLNKDQQVISELQQIAQSNDENQKQILTYIQGTAMAIQQNAQMAKFGAKLNYIKYLKGQCPEGYEMQKFEKGGVICNRCIKQKAEGGEISDPITAYKCGRKMKKKALGGSVEKAACGAKTKKAEFGTKTSIKKCGGKTLKKK